MTRNFLEFADTVPGVVVPGRCQGQDVDPRRRAEPERREPVHRRRRAEGLRAFGRQRPGRRHAGQSVSAARHRRIQGHHVELQGGVRPDLERRDHGDHALGHQRIRGRGLRHLFRRQLARADAGRSTIPASRPNPRPRNTASPSADRSSQDKLHFFVTYEGKRYQTPVTVVTGGNTAARHRWRSCRRMPRHNSDPRPSASTKTCTSPSSTGSSPISTASICHGEDPRRDRRRRPDRYRRRREPPPSTPTTTTSATSCRGNTMPNGWLNEVQLTYEDAFYRAAHRQLGHQRRGVHVLRRRRPEHPRGRRRRSARRRRTRARRAGPSPTS